MNYALSAVNIVMVLGMFAVVIWYTLLPIIIWMNCRSMNRKLDRIESDLLRQLDHIERRQPERAAW